MSKFSRPAFYIISFSGKLGRGNNTCRNESLSMNYMIKITLQEIFFMPTDWRRGRKEREDASLMKFYQ